MFGVVAGSQKFARFRRSYVLCVMRAQVSVGGNGKQKHLRFDGSSCADQDLDDMSSRMRVACVSLWLLNAFSVLWVSLRWRMAAIWYLLLGAASPRAFTKENVAKYRKTPFDFATSGCACKGCLQTRVLNVLNGGMLQKNLVPCSAGSPAGA